MAFMRILIILSRDSYSCIYYATEKVTVMVLNKKIGSEVLPDCYTFFLLYTQFYSVLLRFERGRRLRNFTILIPNTYS